MNMKMQLKMKSENNNDYAVLEKNALIDLSELAKYKALLGYDKIYLKGNR